MKGLKDETAMRIIGITGKSGAGKNTLAGFLARALSDQGYSVKIDPLAAPIKERLRRETRSRTADKAACRKRLQEIGGRMRRDNPYGLIAALAGRNGIGRSGPPPADFLIVPDVRYKNEAEFFARHGLLLFIEGSHRPLAGDEAGDDTEAHIAEAAALAGLRVGRLPGLKRLEDAANGLAANGVLFGRAPPEASPEAGKNPNEALPRNKVDSSLRSE